MTDDPSLPEDTDEPDIPRRGAADARLVERIRAGDQHAFGRLYDHWFDRVHDLAYRILWDSEAAADVAQDAFLSAWRNLDRLEDPYAFGGWLLRIARNGALNRKRKEHRSRPVDEEQLAVIERAQIRPEDRIGTLDDPERVVEDATVVTLLWDAADALGERDREVLDLSLRHGLAPAEIADVVGMNRNAANQLVHRVRQRLGVAVGARVLWRGGTPNCAALHAELAAADVAGFDADAVRVTERHVATCDECEERRRSHLSPAALFAAVPIMSVPALKAKAAAALSADGVPMDGSTAQAEAARSSSPSSRRGRARRIALGGAVAAAVLVGVVMVAASRLDDDQTISASQAVTTDATTSTAPVTTAPAAPTAPTAPIEPPPATVAPPVAVTPVRPTTPPTGAPDPTTTPPAAPMVTFAISPTQIPRNYPMPSAPRLVWNVSGAASVTVNGTGVDSTSFQGDLALCPGSGTGSICLAPPGVYTYVLQARNAAGAVVDTRTQALTIT